MGSYLGKTWDTSFFGIGEKNREKLRGRSKHS